MKRFLGGVRGDPEPSAKRTSSAEIGAAALKDAAWQHFVDIKRESGSFWYLAKCSYCGFNSKGEPWRLKTERARAHLSGESGHGIAACKEVPSAVRAQFRKPVT